MGVLTNYITERIRDFRYVSVDDDGVTKKKLFFKPLDEEEYIEFDLSGAEGVTGDVLNAAIKTRLTSRQVELPGAPVVGVTVDTNPTAIPIGVVDDVVYGRGVVAFDSLFRLNSDGETWTLVQQLSTGTIGHIYKLNDGEVLVVGITVKKSSGWSINPETAIFNTTWTPTPGAGYPGFGVAVHENLVLLAEYAVPREPSIQAVLSTDYGETFSVVRDLDIMYPGQSASVHWHGAGIDGFKQGTPRLWLSHGDGPRAIIYSDDLGVTWTTLPGTASTIEEPLIGHQPTVIASTPYGMVFGTDANPDGIFRVLRTEDPTDQIYEQILMLRYGNNDLGSLYTFAIYSYTDPLTGIVYITFNSDLEKVPALVVATDGRDASIIYETEPGGSNVLLHPKAGWAGVHNGQLLFQYRIADDYFLVRGGDVRQGAKKYPPSGSLPDNGSGLGAADRSSIGIGANVRAINWSVLVGDSVVLNVDSQNAVAIGESSQVGHRSTTVGRKSKATGINSSAFGETSLASAESSVAVGRDSRATGVQTVAIGAETRASGLFGIAIGYAASASAHSATVIGIGAVVDGDNGLAVGAASSAGQTAVGMGYDADAASGGVAIGSAVDATFYAVAIGYQTQTTNWFAVAIGYQATAALNSVAIGDLSSAPNIGSVALGASSLTTENNQIAMGTRHVEMSEITDPPSPGANKARHYYRDNGAGKTQLCVKFPTGPVQVIATEV